MELYKTGQEALQDGYYEFVAYLETNPEKKPPTEEEMIIPLEKGETFPPVRSLPTGGAVWWRFKAPLRNTTR